MLTPGFEPLSPATLFAGVVLATPHHDSQAPARQGSMSQGVLPARDLPSGRSWRLPASPLGSRPDASGGALGEKGPHGQCGELLARQEADGVDAMDL